ncbi:hypothetical protein KIPB_007977 [Kipferlia bialata]|nr:hypothetical protein KIPB_005243 [Kipferlia bialata]GIQ86175.1 hypothetical protein KIPB_007977 [Kipferlia bialata]|eukprot:g5243.t1
MITPECVLGNPQSVKALVARLSLPVPARRLTDEETGIPGVAAIVNSMLERNPNKRPNCAQLLDMVQAVKEEQRKAYHTRMLHTIPLSVLQQMKSLDNEYHQQSGQRSPLFATFGQDLEEVQNEKEKVEREGEAQATQGPLSIPNGDGSQCRHVFGAPASAAMVTEAEAIVKGGPLVFRSMAVPTGKTILIRGAPETDPRPDVVELYSSLQHYSPLVLPNHTTIQAIVVCDMAATESCGVQSNLRSHLSDLFTHSLATRPNAPAPPVLVYVGAESDSVENVTRMCTTCWKSVQPAPSPSRPVTVPTTIERAQPRKRVATKPTAARPPPVSAAGSGVLTGKLHLLGGHASPECLAGLDKLWTEGVVPGAGATLVIAKNPASLPPAVAALRRAKPKPGTPQVVFSYMQGKRPNVHVTEMTRAIRGIDVQCVLFYKGPKSAELMRHDYLSNIVRAVYGSQANIDMEMPVFLYDEKMGQTGSDNPVPLCEIVRKVQDTCASKKPSSLAPLAPRPMGHRARG